MKKEKEETLRIKIYSVKGNYNGRVFGHVDVPVKSLNYEFWLTLLRGTKVPNVKYPTT